MVHKEAPHFLFVNEDTLASLCPTPRDAPRHPQKVPLNRTNVEQFGEEVEEDAQRELVAMDLEIEPRELREEQE